MSDYKMPSELDDVPNVTEATGGSDSLLERVGSAADESIWQQAKLEHDVAGKILDALKNVSQGERRRILAYMWDKYVMNPEPPNDQALPPAAITKD